MERVEKDIVIAGKKVTGQVDTFDRNAGMVADEHVNQREGDGDAFARIEHAGQEGVAFVVVVVGIADENELAGEKVRHDLDLLPAGRGAAKTAVQFCPPGSQTLAVRCRFESPQHGSPQKPAGLLEVRAVVEGST